MRNTNSRWPRSGDLRDVLATMALPPGFAKAVDKAVAARLRTFGEVKTASAGALAEREKRLTEVFLAGRMSKADYDLEWQEIERQRGTLTSAAPAPLFTQQQSVLTTLVDEWDGMTNDEKKRMLAAIFDVVVASTDGVDRLEACTDWQPYIAAALPKPVRVEPLRGSNPVFRSNIPAVAASCWIGGVRRTEALDQRRGR